MLSSINRYIKNKSEDIYNKVYFYLKCFKINLLNNIKIKK